jgi:ParB-like chromosome segregation protein Spo0J
MSTIKWTPQNKLLKDLKPYGKNPRKIGGKKLEDLKESLKRFGMADVITINTDGTIIGGHARYYSLKDAGETIAMCLVPDRTLDDDEMKQLNIRLNKNVAGEWDHDILANEFDAEDLKEWGFEEFELGGFSVEEKPDEDNGSASEGSGECECPECGHIGPKKDFKVK